MLVKRKWINYRYRKLNLKPRTKIFLHSEGAYAEFLDDFPRIKPFDEIGTFEGIVFYVKGILGDSGEEDTGLASYSYSIRKCKNKYWIEDTGLKILEENVSKEKAKVLVEK